MTMGSDLKNSGKNHRDATIVGIRKINDEEFEKEIVKLKAQLDVLMKLLQNPKHGWIMKRTIRWRQKHKLKVLLRE